jgi:hypothetical protein
MNDGSEYLGWVLLGTVSFVVLSLIYEGIRQLIRRRVGNTE